MSSERPEVAGSIAERFDPFEARIEWRAGGVAGLTAALATGVVITVARPATLRSGIAGLYGFEGSLAAGWVVHLVHGTLFGVVFAALLADPGLARVDEWFWKTLVASVVYGVVLAVFGVGLVMPVWLAVVGVETTLSTPGVNVSVISWHVLYGVVLGASYYVTADR
jgi:hypothetical protein